MKGCERTRVTYENVYQYFCKLGTKSSLKLFMSPLIYSKCLESITKLKKKKVAQLPRNVSKNIQVLYSRSRAEQLKVPRTSVPY